MLEAGVAGRDAGYSVRGEVCPAQKDGLIDGLDDDDRLAVLRGDSDYRAYPFFSSGGSGGR